MGCLQSLFDIPPETYKTAEMNPREIKLKEVKSSHDLDFRHVLRT